MLDPLLEVALRYMKHSMGEHVQLDEVVTLEGVSEDRDLFYLEDQDPSHKLDIYYPSDAKGLLPVIVDVHGGAWIYGDKEVNKRFALGLVRNGFAVVNINYTLMPKADIRLQVQEVIAVLHYLKREGHLHHCDIQRLTLLGDSAGAHLSALTYAVLEDEGLREVYRVSSPNIDIRALVSLHGVHDLSFVSDSKRYLFRQASDMMHGGRSKKSVLYHRACLLDVAQVCRPIPMLLVSSEKDDLHFQSVKTRRVLTSLDWPVETLFWKREERLGHVFEVNHPEYEETLKTMDVVFDFINRNIIKVE